MTFEEILDRVLDMLQRRGRGSYPALKSQFDLNDLYPEGFKEEILFSNPQMADEAGRGPIWTGVSGAPATASDQENTRSRAAAARIPQSTLSTHVTSQRTDSRVPDAERRQLTVILCDLVDYP
jgi:hypothetical protein